MEWNKSILAAPNAEQIGTLSEELAAAEKSLQGDLAALSGNAHFTLKMQALEAMGFTTEALSALCDIPKETLEGLTPPLENKMNSGQFFRLSQTITLLTLLLDFDVDARLQGVVENIKRFVPQELVVTLSGVSAEKLDAFSGDAAALSADEKFKVQSVVNTILRVFEIREAGIYVGTNVVDDGT